MNLPCLPGLLRSLGTFPEISSSTPLLHEQLKSVRYGECVQEKGHQDPQYLNSSVKTCILSQVHVQKLLVMFCNTWIILSQFDLSYLCLSHIQF